MEHNKQDPAAGAVGGEEGRTDSFSKEGNIESGRPVEIEDTSSSETETSHPDHERSDKIPAPGAPKALSFGVLAVFLLVLAGGLYVFNQNQPEEVKQFANVYTFVPEKVSKSAPIRINVPSGVSEEVAQASISFSPEIDGVWETEDLVDTVVFSPTEPLRIGTYYAVNMDTGGLQLSGDFFVDEDPQVEAVFPAERSETHEDTEITIVFNRPMVPLTTLDVQEEVPLPISISPETPGRWKWISTRNLQFIPESTLIPSSDYTIEIREGLYSVDGLPVAPMTHTFVTRPLRYEHLTSGELGYRSPILISFNQPVDLESTRSQISVTTMDGEKVEVIVEYGERTYYDRESRQYKTEKDPSKLFVFQRRDVHGRARLWDFDTQYRVTIAGASPLVGTVNLKESKFNTVSVPNIIRSTSVNSERSSLVRTDFFDPQGTITINFYEAVDKNRSRMNVKGLIGVEYAEGCQKDEEGHTVYRGSECVKEEDKETLVFTFDPTVFGADESFALELEKMVTPENLIINAEPVYINFTTYPNFEIIRTMPGVGETSAAIDGMYVCTTVPLKNPGDGGVSEYVTAEGYIVYGRWSRSQYVNKISTYTRCGEGEFETKLNYGLLPETWYEIGLDLTSAFDQKVVTQRSFTTRTPDERYSRFHNMQPQYNVTLPGRTKLTYAVENLTYVDMHICRMEPEIFLEQTLDRPGRFDSPRSTGCTEVVQKMISLPERYWVNNYFQIDLAEHFTDTRGHYIITFSSPLYTGEERVNGADVTKQLYERTYVSVTNLAVGKKEVEYGEYPWGDSNNPAKNEVLNETMAGASNLYWVSDATSLVPVSGASVTQYQGGYDMQLEPKGTGFSNTEGVARTPIYEDLGGAVVRSGLDTAVITDWADTLLGAGETRDASRTYIYTDRPIYRPGHTVYIRGIDRIGFDGSYEVWTEEPVKLTVTDSVGSEVYQTTLSMSQYGTFNTEFDLPVDAALGTYRVEAFGYTYWFSVEEYVPAAFKLEASTKKEEYVNGETAKIEVQADYYFGVPLSEGTVSYSVTAQDYHFDRYADEYFNFGQSWYYCYWCGYGDNFLFRGETEINEVGRAVITADMKLDEYFDDIDSEGSKLVTVSITAKDINGRSVSTAKSFIVHKGEFYLGAKTDRYYTGANTPVTLRVKTVDTMGQPISLSKIERTVYKVNWETFKRQEVDGGFYYRSEKRLEEVSNEKINTDDNGDWSGELRFSEEGQYEVHVQREDGLGNSIKTITNVYIHGSRALSVPPNNNYELELEVERSELSVGDTASLLIKSPYETAKVLIAVERGRVYDYWIVDVTGGLYLHEFPIKSEYAPNIFVSALLLSGDPEVKYGSTRYNIGTDEHALTVSVTPNKAQYLPGEEVELRVETLDHTGSPVPAEVSIAVADLSVLALKGNPKKNPLAYFYDGFPLSVTTASNIKNILYEVDVPLGTKGGGGGSPEDLAAKKRGLFKDTAFWEASVITDEYGGATASFTLPDNLTTWQVESLGVTKDTKLGVDYTEFTTKKDLMAVPEKPRFVVPGDKFSLGAKVFNQTNQGASITVSLESDTLAFMDEQEATVFINAEESKTIYFDVVAPTQVKAGEHNFTFTATDGNFVDAVEQTIPITPNTTHETVATADFTKAEKAIEYVYVPDEVVGGEGGLTINANATMAVFMSDALSYMVTYPYGCSEQLASSLSTIGVLTRALSVPNVDGGLETIEYQGVTYTVEEVVAQGLKKIYENQRYNGGFSYYKGLSDNLWLTLHVVTAFDNLRDAGFPVDVAVLDKAASYIERETREDYMRNPNHIANQEQVILAEYVLHEAMDRERTSLSGLVEGLIADASFLNEKISSMSLAYLSLVTLKGYKQSDRDLVYETLLNRIDIDGRGAYLTTKDTVNRYYFENPIKNTALLLKVFAAHEDEQVTLGNVLRWLLASRDKNGAWGGTHNTFIVVDAMVDFLEWQPETEAHFVLTGALADDELFTHEFNATNVFFTHQVGIDALPRETLVPLTLERQFLDDTQTNLYYDITFKYFLPVESLPPRDEGITITRNLYALDDVDESNPLRSATVGDVIRGTLTLTIPDQYNHVAIEDIIPAGFELVNFNLDTEDQSLLDDQYRFKGDASSDESTLSLLARFGDWLRSDTQTAQVYREYGFGGSRGTGPRELRPTHAETHDDRVFLYTETLSPGVYQYEYYLRALVPGEFQHLPARAEELFFPEVFGRTEGGIVTVVPEK
jgi:uncharacterized protein YfaS (alpha-2-macroglobulin family)